MARNEKTSARVAKIAAKILSIKASPGSWGVLNHKTLEYEYIHWTDLRALAASALTQAPDRLAVKNFYRAQRGLPPVSPAKPKRLKRAPKKLRDRPADKARASYREYVEATATSPEDVSFAGVMTPKEGRVRFNAKPKRKAKR